MINVNLLEAQLIAQKKTKKDLAELFGTNLTAIYRRLKGTSQFTLRDLTQIKEFLHLSNDDFCKIFFDTETETD